MKTMTIKDTKPTTPRGWQRLRKGQRIARHDKVWQYGAGPWCLVSPETIGVRFTPEYDGDNFRHWMMIRRKKSLGLPVRPSGKKKGK